MGKGVNRIENDGKPLMLSHLDGTVRMPYFMSCGCKKWEIKREKRTNARCVPLVHHKPF